MADEPNAGTPIHGVDPQLPTPSRPVSVRKVAANRRNAQHSTGPRTAAGKQAVQRNPLRHGLTARDAVIPDLDGPDAERDFERLRTALRRYYQPTDPLSDLDVDELAFLHWWRRRALRGLQGPVLKRLAAAEQTRADQASQRERDVSVLALVDKEALATSPDAIQSLLAILEEIRLEVDVLGVISERAREQLVAKFSVEPGGFVALCLTYTALAVLGPELVKAGAGGRAADRGAMQGGDPRAAPSPARTPARPEGDPRGPSGAPPGVGPARGAAPGGG